MTSYITASGLRAVITEHNAGKYYAYSGFVMDGLLFIRTDSFTVDGVSKSRLNSNHLIKEL